MSSAVPKNDRAIISEDFDQRIRRRAVAAWNYYSGRAEKQREENSKKEQQPWRIIRYTHIVNPKKYPIPLTRSDYTLPSTLAFQLYYLKKNCSVISLKKLIEDIESKQPISPDTVVVTFDCGFEDFYTYAFPLLQRMNIPATVFLPTGFIGTKTMFWHDKVTTGMLHLSMLKKPFPAFSKLPPNFFSVIEQATGSKEISEISIGFLLDALFEMPAEDRFHTVAELGMILNHFDSVPIFPTFLSWEQIEHINKDSRITFGSMTHGHKILSELGDQEATDEIAQSFAAIAHLNYLPNTISLPFGVDDNKTVELLAKNKVTYALTRTARNTEGINKGDLSLLSRSSMFDDASFCTEFFACRLWGVKFGSFRF